MRILRAGVSRKDWFRECPLPNRGNCLDVDGHRDVRSATIARKFTDKEANCRPDNGTVIRARGWPAESKAAIIRGAHTFPRRSVIQGSLKIEGAEATRVLQIAMCTHAHGTMLTYDHVSIARGQLIAPLKLSRDENPAGSTKKKTASCASLLSAAGAAKGQQESERRKINISVLSRGKWHGRRNAPCMIDRPFPRIGQVTRDIYFDENSYRYA